MRLLTLVATVWALAVVADKESPRESPFACPMEISFETYSVSGHTREELRRSMLENGPMDPYGSRRFAFADWHIRWNWKLTTDGFVDPDTIVVSCSALVKLPRLTPTPGIPRELISTWQEFVGRLRTHELNHVSHARERAGLVNTALRGAIHSRKSLTPAEAQAVAERVTYGIRELDRRYDDYTNHGKTEGAWEL